MAILIVPFVLPLFRTSALAQTTGSRPQPQSEWQLSDAPVKSMVKKRILAELNKAADGDARASAARVTFVRLDASSRMGIEVVAPNQWCGATANCPVWIFDSKTGDLLVNDDGWEYNFRPTTHHGVFDFYVRHNMSAESGTRNEYQFDGKVYEQVNSTDEQY